MSKVVKAVTKPIGSILPGGGGGRGNTSVQKDPKRRSYGPQPGASVKKPSGGGPSGAIGQGNAVKQDPVRSPAPAPSAPGIQYPDINFTYPSFQYPSFPVGAGSVQAQGVAADVEGGLFSAAQGRRRAGGGSSDERRATGVTTRLRVPSEDDPSLGTGTILGSRGIGGQTSFRRKRISNY